MHTHLSSVPALLRLCLALLLLAPAALRAREPSPPPPAPALGPRPAPAPESTPAPEPAASPAPAPAPVQARLEPLLRGIEEASSAEFWRRVRGLLDLGPEAVGELEAAAAAQGPSGRLALARALAAHGRHEKALDLVAAIIRGREASLEHRLLAALLLRALPATAGSEVKAWLQEEDLPPRLAVALEASRYSLLGEKEVQEALRPFLSSPDEEVRLETALALAETGDLDTPAPQLRILGAEQSPRGAYVRLLQENRRLRDRQPRPPVNDDLLRQVIERVRDAYVDEERVDDPADIEQLVVSAASGLVSSLDRFSLLMSEAQWANFRERLAGSYGGIGAVIAGSRGDFTLVSPVFSGPSYRAGLRSRDRIVEVDGEHVRGFSVDDLVSRLKGAEGSTVRLKILRQGWTRPREFLIKREIIRMPTVASAALPGGIGYVRVTSFGEETADQFRKEKCAGVILDLRDNPGGLLDKAVDVAGNFLKKGQLVVYSIGRYGEGNETSRRNHFTSEDGVCCGLPLVVLVNGGSASAAEIVAGALQDHRVGLIVGERTYGKGSVQRLIELAPPYDKMRLRLTVAKYHLPLGRCIHEVGIDPAVAVRPLEHEIWQDDELRRLSDAGSFDAYLDARQGEEKEAVARAAETGWGERPDLPGFDAWYASLNVHVPAELVRDRLREAARLRLAEERGREFVFDFHADPSLRRAVVEILKKLGKDPKTIAPYRNFEE
jgi:carboxyl-terminal processing protease